MSFWQKPTLLAEDHFLIPWIILLNVIITTSMTVVSAVATIIANSSIQGELALSDPQAQWISIFYLLGLNTAVPTADWVAKRFGFKTMYSFGVLLFTLGTALVGITNSYLLLCIARIIEGIGAGFIFSIGLALVVKNFPKPRLGLALNLYVGVGFAGGLGLGLPIAGYLSQCMSWRFIFLGMLPLGILAFLSCWAVHKETERETKTTFDVWGFCFFAIFIASLLTALTFGPLLSTDAGWRTPWIIGCFILALLSISITAYIEKNHPNPLLPIRLFKEPSFILGAVALFLMGMAFFASVSVTSDYMLKGLFYDKYTTGKIAMIYGVTMGGVSILTSLLVKKIHIAILTITGLSLIVCSYFLNNILDWQTGPTQILWILFLRGVGMGLALGPTTTSAMRSVPKELTTEAASLLTFFRQVGGTYGGTLISIVSIKRTIFHATRFSEQANTQLPAYHVVYQKAIDRFFNLDGQESVEQAQIILRKNLERQAYIQGLNDAFIVFGYVVGAVVIILLFLNLWQWWKGRIPPPTPTETIL